MDFVYYNFVLVVYNFHLDYKVVDILLGIEKHFVEEHTLVVDVDIVHVGHIVDFDLV